MILAYVVIVLAVGTEKSEISVDNLMFFCICLCVLESVPTIISCFLAIIIVWLVNKFNTRDGYILY